MKAHDALFFFGPLFSLMTGLSTFLVSACFAEPIAEGASGPSGSDMICVFYYPLHLLLWIFVGLLALAFYHFRYRGAQVGKDNDQIRAVLGYIAGGGLVVAAAVVSSEIADCLYAFVASLVVNIVPAAITFGIGILITGKNRKRLANNEFTEAETNVFHPSLR